VIVGASPAADNRRAPSLHHKPPEGYARWSSRLVESKVGSSASSRPPATPRSSAPSKKRSSAAPPPILGHSAQSQRRVRSGDGGRAVGLYAAARLRPAGGLSGRGLQAARRRNPLAGHDGRPHQTEERVPFPLIESSHQRLAALLSASSRRRLIISRALR
jgi:hypothetical protein